MIEKMSTLKVILERPVRMGGQQHTGWLPAGAARPLPTPIRDLLFNFDIQFDGFGYLLCYVSMDDTVYGDTWHESLDQAEAAALDNFGITANEWMSIDGEAYQ
jgi:hypothetical protein